MTVHAATPATVRVFIVGCPRSGTTMLQRLLSSSLGLFTLPETHVFSRAVGELGRRAFRGAAFGKTPMAQVCTRARTMLGVAGTEPWRDLRSALEAVGRPDLAARLPAGRMLIASIARHFRNALDIAAADAGFAGWIEKTPDHVHYVEFIHRFIPDALVIHIVRPGRETVASIRDAALRYERPWGVIYPSIAVAVARWNASILDSARAISHPHSIALPYDVLPDFPAGTVAIVAEQLGVAPLLVQDARVGQALALRQEAWKADAIKSAPRRPADKWTTVLTPDERAAADASLIEIPCELARRLEVSRTRCRELSTTLEEGAGIASHE